MNEEVNKTQKTYYYNTSVTFPKFSKVLATVSMNLYELKTKIDRIIECNKYSDPKDIEVLVTLKEPSIGWRAFSEVKDVRLGIDWENNQLRIEPKDDLVKQGRTYNDVKKVRERIYENKKYYFCGRCEGKVSKVDKYCKHCSQKLK